MSNTSLLLCPLTISVSRRAKIWRCSVQCPKVNLRFTRERLELARLFYGTVRCVLEHVCRVDQVIFGSREGAKGFDPTRGPSKAVRRTSIVEGISGKHI